MRKNLLILPAMVVAMGLTSCAKTVSKDEALKFVTENYKNSSSKSVKKLNYNWDFSGSTGDTGKYVARSLVFVLTAGKSQELKGSREETDTAEIPPIEPVNKDNFNSRFESDCNFKVKGKELIVEKEQLESGILVDCVVTHNSDGYPYLTKETINNYKIDDSNSVKGSLELKFTF